MGRPALSTGEEERSLRSKRFVGVMSIATVLVMVLAAFAAVPTGAGDKEVQVIVLFDDEVDKKTIKDVGGKIIREYEYIPGVVVTLSSGKINALEKKGKVDSVDIDAKVQIAAKGGKPGKPDKPGDEDPQPDEEPSWGYLRIDADDSGQTGLGVKVAVLDTGIDTDHPDLYVAGGVNIFNTRKRYDDDNGHGTHCAGIIAAKDNTIGVIGVSPGVSLYAVKVLNRYGSGSYSTIISGIEWAITNDMDVISMSLSGTSDVQALEDACIEAVNNDVVVVAAAGNQYDNYDAYPASYASVISVGATDSNDDLADFSNINDAMYLVAPGVGITSTYKGGDYRTWDGTSMACPHVAAVAALVIEVSGSDWSVSDVQTIIFNTAEDIGDPDLFGYGLVDAEDAVA
jgi:subtilisin